MQVIVDSIPVTYKSAGSGPVILLIHGWADSLATFDSLSSCLASDFQVVRLDLPGFGGTGLPPETWGLENYATFVGNFLAKMKIPHVYGLVGHSNGGAISIYACSHKVINPDKLVLIASSGIRGDDAKKKAVMAGAAKTGKLLAKVLPRTSQKKLKRTLYNKVGSDLYVAEELEDTFKKVVSQDVEEDSARITSQTLLIYGENDKATPPSYGQRFADKIKDSKLVVVEDAGHNVHKHQEERVNTEVVGFLK